ncbi:hypothetical protein ABPG72_010019 [Tetrahymena utriculariae]
MIVINEYDEEEDDDSDNNDHDHNDGKPDQQQINILPEINWLIQQKEIEYILNQQFMKEMMNYSKYYQIIKKNIRKKQIQNINQYTLPKARYKLSKILQNTQSKYGFDQLLDIILEKYISQESDYDSDE